MDLVDRIEELQALLEEAKAVPLSTSAVVNRDELLELLAELKQELPEEIRQARWMVRDRTELMDKARREAEEIVAAARAEREKLVSQAPVVRAAAEEAERIVREAEGKAADLRTKAEEYVDAKLASFESLLNRTLGSVTKGREQLRGADTTVPARAAQGAKRPPPFNAEELRERPPG